MDYETYRVGGFLLSEEWKPKGEIFFVIRGGKTKEEHDAFKGREKEKLINEHDDTYTSWVFTGEIYKDLGHYNPHVSVIAFRVRDVY